MNNYKTVPAATETYSEAIKALRKHFLVLMPIYAIGLISFQIYLLYFFMELSVGFHSYLEVFVLSSIALFLFLFFKVTQSIFSTRLYHLINEKTMNVKFNWKEIFYQICVQASSPFMYLVSALIIVSYQAALNYYCHSQIVTEDKQQLSLSERFYGDLKEGRPLLNVGITLHGSFFAAIIFVNIVSLMSVSPYLLNMFLGIETPFIKSGLLPFTMTFFLITGNFTFMICDPIFKAAMVYRYFYQKALPTGEDLKYRVRSLVKTIALLLLVLTPCFVSANESTTSENMEKVLTQKKYQWRDSTKRLYSLDGEGTWVADMIEFLRKFFKIDRPKKKQEKINPLLSALHSKSLMLLLLGLITLGVIALLVKSVVLAKKNAATTKVELVVEKQKSKPDESRYDEYSADEWERAAQECLAASDFRGAIRALYFHTLVSLGKQNLIHIKGYKSSSQYRKELKARSHHYPEVYPLFLSMITEFERAWFSEESIQEPHYVSFSEFVSTIKRYLQ